MEAQSRHRDKMATAAAAREAQEREREEAQIAAWRQVGATWCEGGWPCHSCSDLGQSSNAIPIKCTLSYRHKTTKQAQELQEQARARLEEEQRLAAEAEAEEWEANKHQREVQALLERSGELRELKGKLQVAAVNLERTQQREQRAVIEQREREYAAAMEGLMAQQAAAAAAREAAEMEERRRAGAEARAGLDQQLRERTELQRVARVRVGAGLVGTVCVGFGELRGVVRAAREVVRQAPSDLVLQLLFNLVYSTSLILNISQHTPIPLA